MAPVFDLQPSLEDNLVTLSPLKQEDQEALFQVASDPMIWEQHPAKARSTREGFEVFFKEAMASGGALLIRDKQTGEAIGSSRFQRQAGPAGKIEIGWTFLARRCWGGQYNKTVKKLMLDHAFRFVEEVVFIVDQNNIRSQKAVEKIGGQKVEDPQALGIETKLASNFAFMLNRDRWNSSL